MTKAIKKRHLHAFYAINKSLYLRLLLTPIASLIIFWVPVELYVMWNGTDDLIKVFLTSASVSVLSMSIALCLISFVQFLYRLYKLITNNDERRKLNSTLIYLGYAIQRNSITKVHYDDEYLTKLRSKEKKVELL